MINIGRFNKLKVIKEVPFGLYLEGEEYGEILLPRKAVPANTQLHDVLNVFIYFDSKDKIIATLMRPFAQLHEFAFLKVVNINPIGAFLDWGLEKDLLVPRALQRRPMEKDHAYLVYVTQDEQGRIIASSKLDNYLNKKSLNIAAGEEVQLIIAETSSLGMKVIINYSFWGLLHKTDIFKPLTYGQQVRGFIKKIREDGKLDVTIRKIGSDSINALMSQILKKLQNNAGFLPFHDKSSTKEIMTHFGESKKSFKRAIGQLYKRGDIIIESEGIYLTPLYKKETIIKE